MNLYIYVLFWERERYRGDVSIICKSVQLTSDCATARPMRRIIVYWNLIKIEHSLIFIHIIGFSCDIKHSEMPWNSKSHYGWSCRVSFSLSSLSDSLWILIAFYYCFLLFFLEYAQSVSRNRNRVLGETLCKLWALMGKWYATIQFHAQ